MSLFLESGEGGRRRGRETSVYGYLSCAPYWGHGPQPRHMPWLGIKPVALWFTGQHSIHWATPARAKVFIFKKYFKKATEVNIGLKHLSFQTCLAKPLLSWVPPFHLNLLFLDCGHHTVKSHIFRIVFLLIPTVLPLVHKFSPQTILGDYFHYQHHWRLTMIQRFWANVKIELGRREYGGNISGSREHFPSTPVKYLADLRSRANSQQYSSIYEDQRPKIEDIERSDGEKSA